MNPAAEPVPVEDVQGDDRWMSQHRRFISEAKEREPEVLFIGDSLIQQMQFTDIWKKMFEPLHCLNFGIGGDQTQHVLWRVTNGELENLEPKVIVLLVGTNNHSHTAEQIVGGIMQIVNVIQERQPKSQLIVMGLPPRGEKPNKLREKNTTVNSMLSKELENKEKVIFLDVDPMLFIRELDNTISHLDMYDYVHFTAQGYQKLCEPLLEEMQNLLKVFLKVDNTLMTVSSTASDLDEQQ